MQQISYDQPQAESGAHSPTGQQGYVPDGQQGNVSTGQQGYVPTGQQGYVPTGQQGNASTGQQGYVPTGQQGYVPTGQQGYIPTGQQGYVPTGQQGYVPTGQQGYVPTGHPAHAPTGQPVQSVPGPGVLVQPPVNQPRAGRMNKAHLKTMLGCSRIIEFVLLLIASPCGVAYSNRTFVWNSRASFFAGVSIFSWIMVIVLLIAFLLGIHKDRRYFRTPSYASLIILVVQVFMTILLIASTTSLAMPGVELYKAGKRYRELYGKEKTFDVNDVFLGFALAGGVSACLCFVDDIPQLIKMYRLQRAEEIAAANNTQ